jgi:hypothetical protein
MIRPILLADLDHTLSDAAWRDIHLGDWETYNRLAIDDKPITEIIAASRALVFLGWKMIIVTCRKESCRGATWVWLVNHRVMAEELLMRPDDDYRPSREVKVDLVKRRFGPDLKAAGVAMIWDDREDVLVPFREAGILTMQVHHGCRTEHYERFLRSDS